MLANHIGELLEIVYIDQAGKLSQRRIEIKHIRNGLVYADCLRSGEPRTFKLENILAWQPSKAIRPTISVKQLAAMTAERADKSSSATGVAVNTSSATQLNVSPPSYRANNNKRSPMARSAAPTTRSQVTGVRTQQPALRSSASAATVSHVS
ncbi:hypothetical protein [Paenibacillus wenxiniae]|uniref:WYL domain-containing protein n=1 Tax=Paenibacillus wenxiniae TaxID=1636843 RepID=A0ABW4RGC7_9BACL